MRTNIMTFTEPQIKLMFETMKRIDNGEDKSSVIEYFFNETINQYGEKIDPIFSKKVFLLCVELVENLFQNRSNYEENQ